MRISDWSSDVCSSDLLNERFDPGAAEPCNPGAKQPGAFIFDFGDIRSLLANWGYVQSAMSITEPNRLLLEYTQAMMGFLLFNDSPGTTEIIGLGGGSLAKYCHAYQIGRASCRERVWT